MINYDVVKYFTRKEMWDLCIKLHDQRKLGDLFMALNLYLEHYPDDYNAVYLFAVGLQRNDNHALAEIVFSQGASRWPEKAEMWFGLGTSIKDPDRWEEAEAYLKKGLEIAPKSTTGHTNLGSLYNEHGRYQEALELSRKSLEINDTVAAHDGVAMASYGLEDYATGGDENTYSLGKQYRKEVAFGDEERWDGTKGQSLIIYGEQGIGDEIFYGSAIPDAIRDCKEVIIDCDPRIEGLFRRSFPEATVYGTRDKVGNWMKDHKWDARCAMAGLWQFYRRKREDFPGKPFLKACPVRTEQWKHTLDKTRKNIGVSWVGGGIYTNRKYRCFSPKVFERLDGNLIDLSYEDVDTDGVDIQKYPYATITNDYDNTAALVASLDYVVTTATAVVHLAGGLGIPCYVLRGKYYTWRYAHDMPMYDSVTLIHCDGDWEAGIEEVLRLVEQRKAA